MKTITKNQQLTSQVVLVTPLLAKKWLSEGIDNNRKPADRKINHYAQMMINGEWKLSDAIKFTIDGKLADGQHRLRAVIKANMAIPFLVVTGYKEESIRTFDRGIGRSLSHIAQIDGLDWVDKQDVGTFNQLGALTVGRNPIASLTDVQKLRGLETVKEGLITYRSARNKGRGINSVSLRAVLVRAFYSKSTHKYLNDTTLDVKSVLLDFQNLVQGYDYQDDYTKFYQVELSPSSALRLRDKFLTDNWPSGKDRGSALNVYKAKYVQMALYNYLKNKRVRQCQGSQRNLFPVSWIDNGTFKTK